MHRRSTAPHTRRVREVAAALIAWVVLALAAPPAWSARRRDARTGKTVPQVASAGRAGVVPVQRTSRTRSRAGRSPARRTRPRSSRSRSRARASTNEPGDRAALRSGTASARVEHVHLRRGDTIERLLVDRGVSPRDAGTWLAVADEVFDLRTVRPRHGCTLRFNEATRELESLRYEIDRSTLLVLERTGDTITARREQLPYYVELRGVAGRIDRGLRDDMRTVGLPGRLASDLADIFGWELDIDADMRRGDEFKVVFENIWEAGLRDPQPGMVLGAEIVVGGRRLTAIRFEDEDGNGGYFTPQGEPLGRQFLRYPVDFTEISSAFSADRLHPILGVHRPHRGVDFAAPRGTPVRAAGDGAVVLAGRGLSGLGVCVRIEHAQGITSTYGHLTRIAPGLREGAAVRRGQVIGWVGATGLATGPHLHYEIERGGEHVDPLTVALPADGRVARAERGAFGRTRRRMSEKLAFLAVRDRPIAVSLAPLPAE